MRGLGGPSGFDAPAATRSPRWRRREAELATRVDEVLEEASAMLGADVALGDLETERLEQAEAAMSALACSAIRRLRAVDPPNRIETSALCALIVSLQQTEIDLREWTISHRMRRLADCAVGLSRLRSISTSAELIDRVCEELVRSCGFERAMLSRVEGSMWKPWRAYFSHDREFERQFVEWINQEEIHLDDMTLETEILEARRPTLVYDTAGDARVHRPMVEAGRTISYVAAPITPGGRVVGLLHADYHPSARRVDEVDRDVLWSFAQGFGLIYERTVLLERLRLQRDQIRQTLGTAENFMEEFCDAEIELVRHGGEGSVVARTALTLLSPAEDRLDELTPREREVLRLMAAGATNSAIANELVITEGTVKSHVKHILRKLTAVNRAEAISRYLGVTNDFAR